VRQGWPITVIAACWIAWLAVWLVMSLSTKRTVESSARSWSSVSVIVLFLAWVRVRGVSGNLHDALWAPSTLVSVLTVGLVVAGFAFTVWARVTLGSNWSGSVVFKENHELVEKGPYAYVRHPIYTGLLSMMLGTALYYADALGLVLFAAGVVVLYLKSQREERLMISHFPDEYLEYRRRVKALVPYVL
jgi:protein-S-isoprenylcysteine O-methyltransferase Ste14